MPLRVILADDHALFREGLKSLLRLQPDVEVVAEVDKLDLVRPALVAHPCDLLLLDLQMDRFAIAELSALAAQILVIVVTANDDQRTAMAALHAGARAVVFKRSAVDTLLEAVQAVAEGKVWMPEDLRDRAMADLVEMRTASLTSREKEVIRWVAVGLRNAEVAKKLNISEQTVKTHLNNIFQKVDVRDRVQLTLYAARVGIIGIGEVTT